MRATTALILAILTLTSPDSRASLHPQDGPHAEIRVAIEDDSVRWTLGLNLAFIDEMVEPSRESLQGVSPTERDALSRRFEAYLLEHVRVRIDGEPVTPTLESFQLHADPDPSLVVLFPNMGMRALIRGVAVLVFPATATPGAVELTWPTYPDDRAAAERENTAEPPRMVLEAQLRAEGTMKIVRFSEAAPTVTWHRGWDDAGRFEPVPNPPEPTPARRVPALSIATMAAGGIALLWAGVARVRRRAWFAPLMGVVICAALAWALSGVLLVDIPGPEHADPPAATEVEAAFLPLHANLYKAFDYTAESDVYDSLARSVEGPLLADLYTQVRASLVQAEQGGMLGIVTGLHPGELEVLEISQAPLANTQVAQATLRHTWTVDGTVYHWGHSHTRQMLYEGEYTITALPRGWRITGNRIISQTRLDPGEYAGEGQAPANVDDLLRSVGGDDI